MKKRLLLLPAVIVLSLVGTMLYSLRPPEKKLAGDNVLHDLGGGVYVFRGVLANSGVVVTRDGVLVVDTQVSQAGAELLKQALAKVTQAPVKYVVNTHYHGDHVGGNAAFPGAEIVATEATARLVAERDGDRLETARLFGLAVEKLDPVRPPTQTFSGKRTLDFGGETFELMQVGRTETPDALVVWMPKKLVAFTGDAVSTFDYPGTGSPFRDEGLLADGEWTGALDKIGALGASLLVPGHGPVLRGPVQVHDRVKLVSALFTELFRVAKEELAAGGDVQAVAGRVDAKLEKYKKSDELQETAFSQKFAIYKALNGLLPDRRGKGWWQELRPSAIQRTPPDKVGAELAERDRSKVMGRLADLVRVGNAPSAIAVLEKWVADHPDDAGAWALLSDVLLDSGAFVPPFLDSAEFFVASQKAAREALARDANEPVALMNVGAAEIWSAMLLAQSTKPGIEKLERAVNSGKLDERQVKKAAFFLGKGYQLAGDDARSDAYYKTSMPAFGRLLYPLARERIRQTP